MSTETTQPEQFTFQAEVSRLLHLLSHSLYQNKEVAVRELVSNASDALDKFRHVALSDETVRDEAELAIHVELDEEAKTLTIRDNGIGMTRDELVGNLGTIAHSGSLDFLSKLSGDEAKDVSLIGQFGVGFYSAFMLADRVEVRTRSFQEDSAGGLLWESDGTGNFTIEPLEGETPRGTAITLKLREDTAEFLKPEHIKHVLGKYSTFVPYPIYVAEERVNEQRPIWVEPKSQVTDEQYEKFYQYLSHRSDEKPQWHLHLAADSPFQFHAVLYAPQSNFEKLGFGKSEHGLSLCAKRVLVESDCKDLLPEYLRFIYGLVDSADLPLNVSRQALQDDTVFRKIRKVLVKKVLDHLAKMAKSEPEQYLEFWGEFGSILREGIAGDFENRDKLASLLRFRSSHDVDGKPISLDDYVSRAPEDQEQIYFIGGADMASIRNSPSLEIFKKRGLEVLYLTDPVDEFVAAHLGTFQEKRLVSIDSADVKLPAESDQQKAESEEGDDEAQSSDGDEKKHPAGFEKVVELFQAGIENEVEDVRATELLADSPCRLVTPEGALSTQMQKILAMSNADGMPPMKKILELNPNHPLIERLSVLAGNEQNAAFVKDCGRQLYDNALLLSGLAPNPETLTRRTQQFMEDLAEKRSSLVL
ncbi:molecular chaperone HtpG [Stratiformator vulcanicus]|uniref:Chaperone protein HtpG n=1 Tax=Stratiformator vulcanicus TaxID=2527980 RepID=A0A517QXV0_9PLAN|nr:molecular chaperone HtpG [Stratiformator vulcanicus]QDT36418.1 Chaperone protein HtpG [Stratiformator vulcanicus]